jgi:ATP-binding cassette subfamily B protein
VISGLTLSLQEGRNTAIVGPSGSGKSTLLSLLVRTMDPEQGSVHLDGVNLRDITLASLRSNVSLVLQEAVLFTGTIRENIRFGRLSATDEDVERAAQLAQAHGFITGFPDGYDTTIGERGGTLSGGQRQRIAIARAILRNTPVVLLDEVTTGLDHDARTDVLEALATLSAGRTTVTVTHEASVALKSDRIIWLQEGRVLLDGSPGELMRYPLFARWVEEQRRTGQDRVPPIPVESVP